ncbi:MAG TPA: hypothetical protein VHV83_07040, partial [Armatimonadota bacterium]|nr:hypothetical protein [Armatimonadota bacterium]
MDYSKFQNPDAIFRPAPFWAINDRIVPEETARQMEDMIEAGLSGGFFHSRAGLITDYLSDDWFAAMEAALKVAHEQDGYLWLYDEDLWPSGNAGGRVAAMKDEYRSAKLRAEILYPGEEPSCDGECSLTAAYILSDCNQLQLGQATQIPLQNLDDYSDQERLVFTRIYDEKKGWWSGESYANLLNPEAMQEFVKLTHNVYHEHLGNEFGKRVPGIFTDEPQLYHGVDSIPWYEGFPQVYKTLTGRDFWHDLPYLFFDGPESRKIRLLMYRSLLNQFCEAYSKPIFEWCEQHGLAHTGHYNAEDSLASQIWNHCGSVMAHYRYQQIPGIDHLCRQVEPMLLTVKQVSSAAHQLGRKQVLTEIFGVTRHTNTFQDFKWIGDFDLVLGANFFCPHLTLYSARGRRKRDYPPNWNYQQTYWSELRPLNDYFTRLGAILTSGEPSVDIVMLHPIESATASMRFAAKSSRKIPGEDMSAAATLDADFRHALAAILHAGFECDLGDEWYIDDDSSVEGDQFRIGKMSYSVVVVPPSYTWRPKTVERLRQFITNGGKVIFLGKLPTEIDCEPAKETWLAMANRSHIVPCATRQIQEAVERIAPRTFALRRSNGQPAVDTYIQHRI